MMAAEGTTGAAALQRNVAMHAAADTMHAGAAVTRHAQHIPVVDRLVPASLAVATRQEPSKRPAATLLAPRPPETAVASNATMAADDPAVAVNPAATAAGIPAVAVVDTVAASLMAADTTSQ
jgi:hypothetical protein